jgi:hypothetical protein
MRTATASFGRNAGHEYWRADRSRILEGEVGRRRVVARRCASLFCVLIDLVVAFTTLMAISK